MARTIMAVDDSASIRMMLRFTLGEMGFDIIEAVDGVDALEKLDLKPVDMLITDVNMSELDGISLIRKVRENPIYRFIPIIILTTETSEEKRIKGKQAGATGWIVKPFKPSQLTAVVHKVMG